MFRRDMAISSRLGFWAWIADQYKPGFGVCQPVFRAILINMDKQDRQDFCIRLERY